MISIEELYRIQSIFYFSTLSLLLSIYAMFLSQQANSSTLLGPLSQGFFVFFLIGYYYLFVNFSINFLSKINDKFRQLYSKYKLIIWMILGFIALILIVSFSYLFWNKEKTVETVLSALLLSVIAVLSYLGKKIIDKYFPNLLK
ncbi:MAG: hypothetical protein V1494_01545 [Candidatus Diapherotrites archaeon]